MIHHSELFEGRVLVNITNLFCELLFNMEMRQSEGMNEQMFTIIVGRSGVLFEQMFNMQMGQSEVKVLCE